MLNLNKYLKATLSIGITVALSYGMIYAATNLNVSNWDTLTDTTWNTMVWVINTNETAIWGINSKLTNISSLWSNVGIGTNTPTAKLDITGANTTMLIKDTTVPGAKELRTLLKLQSHFGNQIQFAVDDKPWDEWHVGTSKSGNTFQITKAGAIGTALLSLGEGTMNLVDMNNTLIMQLNNTWLTINGTFVSSSSRTVKDNIIPVDRDAVLELLSGLMIAKWNYTNDGEEIKHVWPIAEEFYELFGLGADDKHIATLDTSWLAIAAIQALNEKSKEKDIEIEELKSTIENLSSRLDELEKNISQ